MFLARFEPTTLALGIYRELTHAANFIVNSSKLWYINMGSVDNSILLSITSHRNRKSTIPAVKTLVF